MISLLLCPAVDLESDQNAADNHGNIYQHGKPVVPGNLPSQTPNKHPSSLEANIQD
jgi:hypothetical protein